MIERAGDVARTPETLGNRSGGSERRQRAAQVSVLPLLRRRIDQRLYEAGAELGAALLDQSALPVGVGLRDLLGQRQLGGRRARGLLGRLRGAADRGDQTKGEAEEGSR